MSSFNAGFSSFKSIFLLEKTPTWILFMNILLAGKKFDFVARLSIKTKDFNNSETKGTEFYQQTLITISISL